MSYYVITDDELIAIADSIRLKTGKTQRMTPADMREEIDGIIAYTNEYLDKLIGRTSDSVSSDTATSVASYAFYNHTLLKDVSLPAVTTVGNNAFSGCSSLENVYLPSLISVGSGAFYNCSNLSSINLENTNISIIPGFCFAGSNLKTLYLPSSVFCATVRGAFSNTPLAADGEGGTIYVPQRYRTTYETNAIWADVIRSSRNKIISY